MTRRVGRGNSLTFCFQFSLTCVSFSLIVLNDFENPLALLACLLLLLLVQVGMLLGLGILGGRVGWFSSSSSLSGLFLLKMALFGKFFISLSLRGQTIGTLSQYGLSGLRLAGGRRSCLTRATISRWIVRPCYRLRT